MKVLRNGQQVSFEVNESGDLVQRTEFRNQASMIMPVKNFLLPMGDDDKIIVVASGLGLARQMVRMHIAEQERVAAENAAWESRGRLAAREQVAQQVANMEDEMLDLIREAAHARRRNLVNLYIGEDRKALIEEEDLIIGVIEEEQAERAGLASSEDILAAFGL